MPDQSNHNALPGPVVMSVHVMLIRLPGGELEIDVSRYGPEVDEDTREERFTDPYLAVNAVHRAIARATGQSLEPGRGFCVNCGERCDYC